MKYAFQIAPHPNPNYNEALSLLAEKELLAMLPFPAVVELRQLGASRWLMLDTDRALDDAQLMHLASHSSLLMLAEWRDGWLRPMEAEREAYASRSLGDIPRYKGKTGASFTRMLIHLAEAAADGTKDRSRLTVLDPMCGRGTTLLCALEEGMNAVGLDADKEDLRQGMLYLEQFMERARYKMQLRQSSLSCGKAAVPCAAYTLAPDKEAMKAGNSRSIRFLHGDATLADSLMKKQPADLLVVDLPYGIQHAPQQGQRVDGLERLMHRVLPSWAQAIRPGGAMAISFNTLVLKREKLTAMIEAAGLTVLSDPPFDAAPHRLEQALIRDYVLAKKTALPAVKEEREC